jgi:hypothetical protein
MKNHDSSSDSHHLVHEELQRMAREELGRSLTEQELHAMAERLMHGTSPHQAFDLFIDPHS